MKNIKKEQPIKKETNVKESLVKADVASADKEIEDPIEAHSQEEHIE